MNMKTLSRRAALSVAVAAIAAPALAGDFNFGTIPDNTVATYDAPFVIVDTADSTLTATIRPVSPTSASIIKMPVNDGFRDGSQGYLLAPSQSWLDNSVEIIFSRPVFCVPGFPIGGPVERVECSWTSYLGQTEVAQGVTPFDWDPAEQIAMGSIMAPEGDIDRIVMSTYGIDGTGLIIPVTAAFGDFFAVAVEPACPADVDATGTVDVNDYFAFLGEFFTGTAIADMDRSGEVDLNDYFSFLGVFFNSLGSSCN